jgi:SSS family solute:Na+ symporter
MSPFLLVVFFLIMGFVYACVGYYASLRIQTNTDYFLAGRRLGSLSVASTLIATQLGGAMLLGTSQWAYTYGYYGFAYCFGAVLGFVLLAVGFASKLQQCNVTTVAEIFELHYHSVFLRKFASSISIISLWGILVMLVVASRALIVSIGDLHEWAFIFFWFSIVLYTMVGGLHAVVATDKVQLPFILSILGSIFLYCVWYQPLGLVSVSALITNQKYFDIPHVYEVGILKALFMPALFALIEQDLAQCFFAARSKRVAFTAACIAALVTIGIGAIPVYFGMQARLLGFAIAPDANPLIVLLQYVTNDYVFGLALCGIFAAIVSTADTLLCAVSSNIVEDFGQILGMQKNYLNASKMVTCIAGIAAFIVSYLVQKDIIAIAVNSYALSVSCLLIPVLYALFQKKGGKNAAFGSVGLGLCAFILFTYISLPVPKEFVAIIFSWVGYIIGARVSFL